MQRRKLLALTGAGLSLAVAGCAGTDDDDRRDDSSENGGDDGDATENGDGTENGDDPGNGDDNGDDGSKNDDGNGDENGDDENGDENGGSESELTTLTSIRDVDDRYDDGAVSFSGSGQSVTDEFSMSGAMTVAIFEHDGESNFQIELLDADGELVELIANEIGAVDGAIAFPLEGGDYVLDVNADGDWSLELAQPLAPEEDVHRVPVDASGEGPDVVGPVELDGLTTITGTHGGESNFIVEAIDEDATSILSTEVVFNEIGEHEGEASTSLDAIAWFSVQADGSWSLDVE